MSLLSEDVHNQLRLLLQGLQSPQNEIRTPAEETLNQQWVQHQPDVLLMGLVERIHSDEDIGTRGFAAVLFRRMSAKTRKVLNKSEPVELFLTLAEPQKVAIRTKLLQCLELEQTPSVRNKIADAVAEIARQYTDDGQTWPELLNVLFHLSQAPIIGQRESAYRIFSVTPAIIEKQHADSVKGAFSKAFKDDAVEVRLAAMDAFASFFRAIDKKSQKSYGSLIPDILNIVPPLKDGNDSENLTSALMSLIELAEIAPTMFKGFFGNLVLLSISIIQTKDLGDQPRQNALELMATFADYAPGMCKKDPRYVTEMVTQCLSLMTDIGEDDDDASEWNTSEDLDVEESDLNHVAGEQCMDRLANKLGGGVLLGPTFQWLPKMMQSMAWRDRHAALMAISAISEGCRDEMVGELKQVLDIVIPALSDPHPRVRWAGCNALGQMSTDFAGVMQEKYHREVLSNIIPVLNAPEPRVQSHAAAALVNFCEEADRAILEPYLDTLIDHLLRLLPSTKIYVQEQALSTIATVADSAETAFGKYYDRLMPSLFSVLEPSAGQEQEQGKEYRLLKAKAMECATLIALAVGKQRMGQDALRLVNALGNIQNKITEADDPQAQYLLHSWGRMARVLEDDFVPFLPSVMPPLLELAKAKADITLLEDDEQIASYEQEDGWELVPLKGKVIGIKTSILEDKHMAIELIYIYAQQLKAHFAQYVEDILHSVSLPGLAFFFHDPVRVASAKSVPMLLNSFKLAHGPTSQQLRQLWEATLIKLLEVLEPEANIDTLAEMYQCFYESIEVIGRGSLERSHMDTFITHARRTLEEYQIRANKRVQESQDVDDEEENEELLYQIEEDQTLLSDMNKAFHTIFKHHGVAFLPSWEHLTGFYDAFITSSDPTQRQWALCIMDDVLEFCGEQSWNYQRHIRQPLLAGLQDPNPANRQAACYGVGIAAQKGGQSWSQFVLECLPTLFQVCSIPNARADDDVFATENACASIAKILQSHGDKVPNPQEIIAHWINTLPVVNDEEAAPYAYMYLASLIEQRNPAVLQLGQQAFLAICSALEAETIQGQTSAKVVESAKQLVAAASLDANALLSTLAPETQQTVRAFFG